MTVEGYPPGWMQPTVNVVRLEWKERGNAGKIREQLPLCTEIFKTEQQDE